MSDGKQSKGRARGRAVGKTRGAHNAPQQFQQQSASPQQPQQAPSQYQQPCPSHQSQQQMQGGASGVQQGEQYQDRRKRPCHQQDRQQQECQQQEEGAYGVDPNIKSVSGAFRGMSIGESRPGPEQALRRGALRGRLEMAKPPIKTRADSLKIKTGTMGIEIPRGLLTNHYRLIKSTKWSLYQYRVDFSPEEERTKVRKALLSSHKDTLGEAYLFDGSMLFCIQKLHPDISNQLELFSARDIDNQMIRITIRFTNELALGDYQYIQLFNIILRNCMDNMKFQLVGREYFDPGNSLKLPNFKLEIWPGYNTSILQFEDHIMMGIDVSHKVLRSDNALEFLRSCRERYGAEWQAQYLKFMLGAVVFTFYNNKPYRVDDVAYNMTPRSTFKKGNDDISYVEYYKTKYQLTITDFNQPLLVSKPKNRDIRGGRDQNIILVPQFCQMTGLTDEMRNNFNLMKAVADRTRVPPNERVKSYKKFMQKLKECEDAMYKLNMWNVQFASDLERVPARVYESESLYMYNGFHLKANDGDWSRELRNCVFFSSVRLERWVVIATKQAMHCKNPNIRGNAIDNFLTELSKAANTFRFELRRPRVVLIDIDRSTSYTDAIERAIATGGLQLVMCIINPNRPDLYYHIKRKCLIERPMASQVITSKTLGHKSLLSVCTKIIIQMNCKLGGCPWTTPVPLRDTFIMSDGTEKKDALHATMVVGFDVCHDARAKNKSVGALVASIDLNFSRYYSAVSKHDFGEELSNDIAVHVSNAVVRFEELNKYYPPKIILFRDGVGESNIRYVLDHEIVFIKDRLIEMFPNATPKLTVVIVSKRIQTRFFVEQGTAQQGFHYTNPPPGTIVDDVVTQPEKYDFFLVSQSVRQGTVTPTNYNVIFDDSALPPDHIQRLAYKMCHLYYNCTSTVRVPCQVQYAHKLAFLVGQVTSTPPSPALSHLLYFL